MKHHCSKVVRVFNSPRVLPHRSRSAFVAKFLTSSALISNFSQPRSVSVSFFENHQIRNEKRAQPFVLPKQGNKMSSAIGILRISLTLKMPDPEFLWFAVDVPVSRLARSRAGDDHDGGYRGQDPDKRAGQFPGNVLPTSKL